METTSRPLEEQRLENIRRNRALLKDMGIHRETVLDVPKVATNRPTKRRKTETVSQPSRFSERISSAPSKAMYADSRDEPTARNQKRRTTSKIRANMKHEDVKSGINPSTTIAIPQKEVEVLRAGWTDWKVTAPPPTRDENATFHFSDKPSFVPNKSPEEMIREGCFGGSYFRPLYSRKLSITIADDWRELPKEWISGLDIDKWLTSPTYDPDINKYKVACGQSIEEWEAAGWINHAYDVRGWFQ